MHIQQAVIERQPIWFIYFTMRTATLSKYVRNLMFCKRFRIGAFQTKCYVSRQEWMDNRTAIVMDHRSDGAGGYSGM